MQSPTRREAPEGKRIELVRTRLPRWSYAVDRLGGRLLITSIRCTLRWRHIQANPPWMRVFAILDRLQFHAYGQIKRWCTRRIRLGASGPGDA